MSERVPRERLREVAVEAARAGATHAAERFRAGEVNGEYTARDVKTDVDVAAERAVLDVVERAFPGHAVHAEEAGRIEGDDYEWLVDPLDGTNNLAAGVPMFATAVAVADEEGTLVSVVEEPLPADTYLAERGAGATVNGDPLRAESDLRLDHGTVSLVPGEEAVHDPHLSEELADIEAALAASCKRVLSTWSPVVDWGLLARGGVEAVVTFHPNAWEQRAGELLAQEAGAAAWTDGPVGVFAVDEATRDALVESLPQ